MNAKQKELMQRAVQEMELALTRTIRDMRPMLRQKYDLDNKRDLSVAGTAMLSVALTLLSYSVGLHEDKGNNFKREAMDEIKSQLRERIG